MITEIKGNLITLSKEKRFDAIAHQCNCFCTMKSGIAPQIVEAFPIAKEADDATERGDHGKMGKLSMGQDEETGTLIFNIYGQYGWNKNFPAYDTNYEKLFEGLRLMEEMCKELGVLTVGFPKIGCGLAGGDWDIVKPEIERIFDGYDITFVEYES